MARTKFNPDSHPKLAAYSQLISRAALLTRLGMSYNNNRDLYQALGYQETLQYDDFLTQYLRQDIARAIVERPITPTWRGDLRVVDSSSTEVTPFESQFREMSKRVNLKQNLIRLDRVACLGAYAVLLLGFSDVGTREAFAQPVRPGVKLVYCKAYAQPRASVLTYDEDSNSPRYGMPVMYELTTVGGNDAAQTFQVHHTRIIHVIKNELDDDVEGLPELQAVFNRLKDLEKLTGGSAEMYWRGARPGFQGIVDPEFTIDDDMKEDLQTQLDEYEHNLRRFLMNEGVKFETLAQQVADPQHAVEVQIMMISAVTGIPKRVLTGSERGELASTQDQTQWNAFITDRREEYAEPKILRPVVDRLIELKVLPAVSGEGYTVDWLDIHTQSDHDKAEVGRIRATALKEYSTNPIAEYIVPARAFYEFFLGLDDMEIDLLEQYRAEDTLLEEREADMLERGLAPAGGNTPPGGQTAGRTTENEPEGEE